MLVVELLGMVHCERSCHIVLTLRIFGVHLRLLSRITASHHMGRIHLNTRHRTDAPGDVLRLVIPPLTHSSRVQRKGHNHIDPIPETGVLQLHRGLPAQAIPHFGPILVLQLIHHALYRMVFLKEQVRRSAVQVHRFHRCYDVGGATRQSHLRLVLPQLPLLGPGQSGDTSTA